ncbi:OmpA family protein [Cupriavidus malaysiensis]|uniref:OmpA-like domain-containing protein n=1 Tax=Cupriavidus malaysiensis TaxID=367825 RepID=A0ABN4TVH7_9BURK|nr:OmpA family protein [Cupriavidus malaysiensis]AOZ11203.1 hypothetical protein BKK80_35205 [Cupriavidus malaysiensis]
MSDQLRIAGARLLVLALAVGALEGCVTGQGRQGPVTYAATRSQFQILDVVGTSDIAKTGDGPQTYIWRGGQEYRELRFTWQAPVLDDAAIKEGLAAAIPTPIASHHYVVTFPFNGWQLGTTQRSVLDELPTSASEYAVTGHTDSVGSDRYNEQLSAKRAETVKNYLIVRGVDRKKIETRAAGEREPAVPNDTPDHRAQNRRAEVELN